MTSSRREFLSETALAAAAVGLGPGVAAMLAEHQRSGRPYLDLAVRCAQWIDRSTQEFSSGLAWPADPLNPKRIGLDFYNGTPGVVTFFANLAHATGDARWRERADRGGMYLLAESARQGDALNAGLYTGLAGLGTTYLVLDTTGTGLSWSGAAKKLSAQLITRAKQVGDGSEWSDSNDIISGTAGTGLFLLQAASRWGDRALLALAVRAGRRLLKTAHPSEGGLMWFPAATGPRNYPNFSHGTSGVAYFLASLYRQTKERAFLDGALAGVKYLEAVATRRNGTRAIFHVSGGGENRYYLSWCHGPVGTARLFARLHGITKADRWRIWVDELTAWLVQSGAPEKPSDGYWNNISQCCGDVGIGQYAIDLARYSSWQVPQSLRPRVVSHLTARATDDTDGLRWVQAEHRVQPENLVAQTGFMQGAAGVGTFFLQLDAFERNRRWMTPLPDTPWVK
jgi:lantibiotic modifying enzyme